MVESPLAIRRRGKRSSPSSIERYLSPSPKKKQRSSNLVDIENVENGLSRQQTEAIDLTGIVAETDNAGGTSSTWGLQRIENLEDSLSRAPLALLGDEGTKRLQKGSILGRQVSTEPPKRGSPKVNLGIPSSVVGVSRKHIEISDVESELRIKLIGMNSVAIHSYRQRKNKYRPASNVHPGESRRLKAGDVMVLDSYETTRGGKPEHLFRVVLLQAGSPTKRRKAGSCATIDLSQTAVPLHELSRPKSASSILSSAKPTKLKMGRSDGGEASKMLRGPVLKGASPVSQKRHLQTAISTASGAARTSNKNPTQKTLGSWLGRPGNSDMLRPKREDMTTKQQQTEAAANEKSTTVGSGGFTAEIGLRTSNPDEGASRNTVPTENNVTACAADKTVETTVGKSISRTESRFAAPAKACEDEMDAEALRAPPVETTKPSEEQSVVAPHCVMLPSSLPSPVPNEEEIVATTKAKFAETAKASEDDMESEVSHGLLLGIATSSEVQSDVCPPPHAGSPWLTPPTPDHEEIVATTETKFATIAKASKEEMETEAVEKPPEEVSVAFQAQPALSASVPDEKGSAAAIKTREGNPRHVVGDPATSKIDTLPSPQRSANQPSEEPAPEVGDRFRVRYEVDDTIMKRKLNCWWFGNGIDVSAAPNGTYKIKVTLEGHRTLSGDEDEFNYPSPEIELIRADPGSPTMFRRAQDGTAGDVVLDENPEQLNVGDLVDCKFQDGMDVAPDQRDMEWHRGRIAKVDRENRTCNVVYFDGDYEGLVPIGESKIKLVDSGKEWLLGQKVRLSLGLKGHRGRRYLGEVTKLVNFGSGISCLVSFSTRKPVTFRYEDVVKAVFEEIWEQKRAIACRWPGATTCMTAASSKFVPPKSATKVRPLPALSDFETDHKELSEKQEHVKEKLWSGEADSHELQEMHPSLSSCLWGALNSESPMLGTQLAELGMCVHKQGPSTEFGRNLLDLVVNGPRHDGKQFADPCRIRNVVAFTDMCSEDRHRMGSLSKSIQFESFEQLEVLVKSFRNRVYEEQGDSSFETVESLPRVARSLQLASAAAHLTVQLLHHQLEKFIDTSAPIDRSDLRCVPLVRCLRKNGRGLRDSFKTIIGLYAKCFVEDRRYHLQLSRIKRGRSGWPVAQELLRTSKKLCRDLGSIASHAAWIYATDGNVRMSNKQLANVCRDALLTELDSAELAPPGGKRKAEAYLNDLKCRWALGMSSVLADPLVGNVGAMLGVGEKVSFCLDPEAFLG